MEGKKRSQESVGSVDFDPEGLTNRKEAGREADGAQSLRNNSTVERACHLCHV